MSTVVRFDRLGGPEVLVVGAEEVPAPKRGEVRLRHQAIGVNFIDTYHRSGVYPVPLPSGLGTEAAGVIEQLGPGVDGFQAGDRVAYVGGPLGAYAEVRNLASERLVRIPDAVPATCAAALMLKGITAYYLMHLTFAVRPGHRILVHAAAGGVGSILVPWAKSLGAMVIGTVGSEAKVARARSLGCDHVLLSHRSDLPAAVRDLTGGAGVQVVYDGVGKETLMASLDCLGTRGMLVSFGNASGKPPAIEPGLLAQKGSLFLTRPTLAHYTATRQELETAADAVFRALAQGIVRDEAAEQFPLAEAAKAHAALESRRTTGSLLLIP